MSPQEEKKQRMLDRVAEENGVAVVVLDENSHEVSVSNNNSICKALTSSKDFAPHCARYCGMAFRKTEGGREFEYECHAGLVCKAVPVTDHGNRFVAIIGRTFSSADNYRKATERTISGDWAEFPPNEFFENVLLSSSTSNIDKAAGDLARFRPQKTSDEILDLNTPRKPTVEAPKTEATKPKQTVIKSPSKVEPVPPVSTKQTERRNARSSEAAQFRSLFARVGQLPYDLACEAILDFLSSTFRLGSVVWLERKDKHFVPVAALGKLRETPIRIGIATENSRVVAAAREGRRLELRERIADGSDRQGRLLNLFMVVVGGEIRAAIGVEGMIDEERSAAVMRSCRRIGPQVEILRLQHEITSKDWLNRAVIRFNESLKRIDAEDFWTHLTQLSAELVQSERASLLIRDDQSDALSAKAAVGARLNLLAIPNVGEDVARVVLAEGDPVLVEDIRRIGIRPAPADRQYKTSSFISYPIMIGDRRIGVMNFTDKASGDIFTERDMEMLRAIAPQIAVAVDRTVLKSKAGELEQLSVTDALTGLLNRRYLDKRLIEEIQRSKRHRFPMSLMMLDIDGFKPYNDTFGHQAGDQALKIVAGILQDILRGDDVAARYGGEEFAILLPQTTSSEAAAIAERLRQRIEHTEFPKRKITVSIGIASCSNDIDTPADIIGAADHALYEAKNHGRNNVRVYDGFGKSFNEKIN